MTHFIITISSLLLSIGIMLCGHGLLGTLLALRGMQEGFGPTTIGFITSMYFIGYIYGTFICPHIIKRVGHIRTLASLAAIFASSSILLGFWINIVSWSAIRFVSGVCLVGSYMVIESWLNSQASNDNRGRVFGINQLINLSFLAGSQFLILTGDIRTIDMFAISAALISISLVPVALTRLPEPPAVVKIEIALKKLYQTSPLGFMGCLISGIIGSIFWGLGPFFARQAGLDNLGVAIFMSTTILGGVVLQLPVGLWSDRNDRRLAIMLVALASALMALLAIFSPAGQSSWLSICMFLFGGMMFTIYPLSVAHANDHPGITNPVAVASNLLLTYGIGAALGPALGGLMIYLFGHKSLLGIYVVAGLFLGIFAYYRKRHGVEIPVDSQTTFMPLVRTSQVMAEVTSKDLNLSNPR